MATQTEERRLAFLATALPPIVWVVAFFLAPLAIVWAYSFGQNEGLTGVDISGTFANYVRAIQPLYLGIFAKSIVVAGLTTLLCLIIGFPVALAIVFASERWRAWMLLLIMLPFWTNLLIRTYSLIAVLRTEGYVNFTLAWFWDKASWLMTLVGLQPLGEFTPLQLLYSNFAVVVGLVYVHLPFMVLPLYAALDRLDKSLIEASLDLGAGHSRTLWSDRGAASVTRHHLRHHHHLCPGARRLSHARSPRRPRQPDDRQRHRTPVQAGQRLAVRRRVVVPADVRDVRRDCPARLFQPRQARRRSWDLGP